MLDAPIEKCPYCSADVYHVLNRTFRTVEFYCSRYFRMVAEILPYVVMPITKNMFDENKVETTFEDTCTVCEKHFNRKPQSWVHLCPHCKILVDNKKYREKKKQQIENQL
jgi:hypothetical protein